MAMQVMNSEIFAGRLPPKDAWSGEDGDGCGADLFI
jgi:hypothetical protein